MTQIPEGRQPMQSDDMAKLHPSTWAEECEQLRAKYDALREVVSRLIEERDRALAWRDKDWQASQENTALRARVAELEAALRDVIGMLDDPTGGEHVRDMRGATAIARAALQQPTEPHTATHSAKSDTR